MSGLSHFNCELLPNANIDNHLICPICKKLMNRPVSLSCGHSGCQECLQQLISTQSGIGREKTCAVCREKINEKMLNISIPLSSVISKLTVKCTNVGCTWVGEHGCKERHREICAFLVMECPNGYAGSYLRDSIQLHIEICPKEKIPCQHCTAEVGRFKLDLHEQRCQEKPGPCPLNCGHNFPRFVLLTKEGGMRVLSAECNTLVEDQVIGAREDLGPIEKEQDLTIEVIIAVYKHT